MKFSSWQLFYRFEEHDRDAARGGSLFVFFIPRIVLDSQPPVCFSLLALRLPRDAELVHPIELELTLGRFQEVEIPIGMVRTTEVGGDQGKFVFVGNRNEDELDLFTRFCTNCSDLDNIPASKFGERMFAVGDLEEKGVDGFGARGKEFGDGTIH